MAEVVGVGCALAVVIAVALTTWMTVRNPGHRPWWSVVLCTLAAGTIVGTGWRTITTGVIGANIGAGVTIGVGAPAVTMLLLWVVVRSVELLRSGAPPR